MKNGIEINFKGCVMAKDKCGEEAVCSLFVILERLEREGMFESFTPSDYEKSTDSMVEYFLRFKKNRDKYEKFNEDRPFGNFINIVSKHPFSLVDFNEAKGSIKIGASDNGSETIISKYDIGFDAVTDTIKHKKNAGVVLDYNLNTLNVALNYNREGELMIIQENLSQGILRKILVDAFSREMNEDGNILSLNKNISDLAGFVKESSLLHSVLERVGADKNIFNEHIESNLARSFTRGAYLLVDKEGDYSSLVSTSDTPIFMNNEPFMGSFYDKEKLIDSLVVEIQEGQSASILNILNIDVEEDGTHEDYELLQEKITEMAKGLEPFVREVVRLGVELFQDSNDNIILECIMKGQNGSSLYATQDLLARNLSKVNEEIVKKYTSSSNKDGVIFSFEALYLGGGGGKIHSLPVYDKENVSTYTVEPFVEILNRQDPMKKEKYPVTPKDIRFTIDFKKKESLIELVSFMEEHVNESMHTNDSMKYYMLDREYLEKGNHELFVIDEGDSKPNGKMAMVFKAVARNSNYCILASGTAVNGFPASIVPMLAYNGKMDVSTIAQNENEFTKQCGVFEINSKLLGKILYSITNDDFKRKLEVSFNKYSSSVAQSGEEKLSGENIMKFLTDELVTNIMPLMINLDLVAKSEIDDIEIGKEARKVKTLFDSMISVSKKLSLSFEALIKEGLSNSHSLTKLRPAISSPLTYVQMISSTAGNANITIQTREGLSGKKEKKEILDLVAYEHNFMKGEKNLKEDEFAKNNRGGVRLAQVALREYANVNFLHDTAVYLSDNFKYFSKNFSEQNRKENKVLLVELTALANDRGIFGDRALSTGQVLTLLKKRTSGSSDSIDLLYKSHLDSNGNIRSLSEFKNMDENKYNLFVLLLEMYDSFMKVGLPMLNSISGNEKSKLDKGGKYNLSVDDKYVFDLTATNFYYTDAFVSLDNELETASIVRSLENGYPEGEVFAVPVDMCPHDLRYIINRGEDEKYLPFILNLKRREENQLFDALGSLGYGKKIKSLFMENKSCVIASTRTAGTFFNLLTTLDAIIKGKAETGSNEQTVVVLNEPSSSNNDSFNFRELYSRIDRSLLEKHNIKIDKIRRTLLDSTVKGYRGDKIQTFVISNYESASRGLDLSSLDEIVVTAGMAKGKEAIQFSARLFSVHNQEAKMSYFNGGSDACFVAPSVESKQALIAEVFGEVKDDKELGDILTSLVGQEATGVIGEQNNKETLDVMFRLAGGESKENLLVKTESGSVARLCKDKSDVYDQFMSGNSTSIDSATGKVQSKENLDAIKFASSYSDKKRAEKLEKIEKAVSNTVRL